MNYFDKLRILFYLFSNREKPSNRKMKRVFQWSRYLEWKDLTSDEKLLAKRFLLLPIFAYLIIGLFNQNFFLIVLLLIGYVLYKRLEKGNIVKK